MNRKKQIEDMLLAGCLGDCIGYSVEFISWESIQSKFGKDGIQDIVSSEFSTANEYEASDDTQMTLFCTDGIIKACQFPSEINVPIIVNHARHAMLEWYDTQSTSGYLPSNQGLISNKVLWKRQAPGTTCLHALSEGAWGTPYPPINDSKGCGSVMRVAPYGALKFLSHREIWSVGVSQAAQTHGHPDGYGAAGALALIVALLLEGAMLRNAVDDVLGYMKNEPNCRIFTGTYQLLKKAVDLEKRLDHNEMNDALGEGWVADECLAIAVYCSLWNTDVTSTIRHAANHRGDSDSTASIAAQLNAIELGLTDMEREDALKVDLGELCLEYAGKLHDAIENVHFVITKAIEDNHN